MSLLVGGILGVLASGCGQEGLIRAENGVLRELLVPHPGPATEDWCVGIVPDPPLDPNEYVAGPGDVLRIEVTNSAGKLMAELSGEHGVPPTGVIVLPYVGRLEVSGKAVGAIEAVYAKELKDREVLLAPTVEIFVQTFRRRVVTLTGAVSAPGEIVLPDKEKRSLQVLLCMVARPDPGADLDMISIFRPAELKRIYVSWFKMKADGEKFFLEPGDQIEIPREESVKISGELKGRGGEFPYEGPKKTTIRNLVELAGGLGKYADSEVILVRRDPDGEAVRYEVDLDEILDEEAPDIPLHPGDQVIVEEGVF